VYLIVLFTVPRIHPNGPIRSPRSHLFFVIYLFIFISIYLFIVIFLIYLFIELRDFFFFFFKYFWLCLFFRLFRTSTPPVNYFSNDRQISWIEISIHSSNPPSNKPTNHPTNKTANKCTCSTVVPVLSFWIQVPGYRGQIKMTAVLKCASLHPLEVFLKGFTIFNTERSL